MRVKPVFKPGDYPGEPDDKTRLEIGELFCFLFPGVENPEIDDAHAGIAITAQNPKLAVQLAQLSRFVALDTDWCQRADLRELAIQTVNLHFKSGYSYRTRLAAAKAVGIDHLLPAIQHWQSSDVFDAEQRLVIEYTQAVVTGEVPAPLFKAVVDRYGEKQAIEFTSVIGLWSFWAMMLNATRPEPL